MTLYGAAYVTPAAGATNGQAAAQPPVHVVTPFGSLLSV
jgi:hypothetical protein